MATTNGGLHLVAATPNAGYTVVQRSTSPGAVQVTFRSSTGSSWIRVDLVGDQLQPTTGQSGVGDDHGGSRHSAPSTMTPPASDGSRTGVSYPSGHDSIGGTTDSHGGYRRP